MPSSHTHAPGATTPHAALLAVHGLACQRGERTLFEGLELFLQPGQLVWLRGRNGRGKTSLLRLLAGLSAPVAGSIQVAGQDIHRAEPAWRRHWTYVAHHNALKDDLTATEALHFLAQLHGLPAAPADLHRAMQRLGIANRRHAPVRTLSQGQRRRVALARLVLCGASPLWLLDEPFDALDADGIEALNSVISEHVEAGGAVVLTSHQALSLRTPQPRVLDLETFAPSPRALRQAP